MNVMLVVMFGSVALGLFGQKWAHRETQIVVAIATVMAVAYFVHPGFMS